MVTGDVFSCSPNNIVAELNDRYQRKLSMGVIDGNTTEGKIKCQGINPEQSTIAKDDNRKSLKAYEWINEFDGQHGLHTIKSPQDTREALGCYSFSPSNATYLKIICLDDIQLENDGNPGIHGHGFLDSKRWEWLKEQLRKGQTDHMLMIIAAHAPIGVTKPQIHDNNEDISPMGWADFLVKRFEGPTEVELLEELYNTPNLLMWIAGHRHLNSISVFKAPHDDNSRSFWQVETSSLRDFPQQFRTFEIGLSSNVVSVKTTNVDYEASHKEYPAAKSREYAAIAQQIADNQEIYQLEDKMPERKIHSMPLSGSYNAVLFKEITDRYLLEKMYVSNVD
jgi:hypothetical protein